MLSTDTIQEFDPGIANVHAFRITGAVTRDDMAAMGERMNTLFDALPKDRKIDMLLVFDTDRSAEAGANWSTDAMTAQAKAVTNVRNYVVANAPGDAGGIVETVGKVLPVEAKSFDSEEAALAWLKTDQAQAA
ncbi:STAS/SEC14 domain-containing protein [Roseibacterium beibuensis]|uniref:SpoIIAA-like protein n=1 Tax=[Roseibacterium] beibuensis TaxID=1193142 RepID=A0ABP9LBD6_9RHOB|nr:STAS/SEC14 domain-containing protein [Roseibacterium beibuensis]MCS6624200.1 STAS/SEC14 domain-containing protein [Roseibacterium beibuensis]